MAQGRFLNNNSLTLYSALRPVNDFALRAAEKDQQLQMLSYLEENQRQKTAQTQAQIQMQNQWKAQLNAIPFEAPDRQRLTIWANNKEKELRKRIDEQYGGDIKKYMDAEGTASVQNILTELTSSDVYNMALKNKENMAAARKATVDNKNLIGSVDPRTGLYKAAEQDIMDFYSGVNPTFEFRGAYDPSKIKEVSDFFAKQDNPNGSKYDRNATVPEIEKLIKAREIVGDAAGDDAYYRTLIGRPMHYKRYSIEDEDEYLRGVQKDAASLANTKANTARTYQSMRLAASREAREQAEFEAVNTSGSYINEVANTANPVTKTYQYTPETTDVNRNLTTFERGYGLSNMVSNDLAGNQRLNFFELAAPVGRDLISQAAGTSGKEAKITEAILPSKGGAVLNLKGVDHKIISNPSNVFYMDERTYGDPEKRDKAYQRVTIEVGDKGAAKLGLLNDGIIFDNVTRLGTDAEGVRRTDGGYVLDVLVPFRYTPVLDKELNKYMRGQKGANEVNYNRTAADLM